MSDIKNARKRRRNLDFNSGFHSVFSTGKKDGIVVTLDDLDEPDREVWLTMSEDDALRLASRIAFHLGYKLVEATQ